MWREIVRLLRMHVEPVEAVEQAESVAGFEYARFPCLLARTRPVRLRCLDDEDPRAPPCEVEPCEHVSLASLHVDGAEVNGAAVETGVLEEVVKRLDAHDDLGKPHAVGGDPVGDGSVEGRVASGASHEEGPGSFVGPRGSLDRDVLRTSPSERSSKRGNGLDERSPPALLVER